MTRAQIETIIESKSLASAVFEADLYTFLTDEYYTEFDKLPEWLQTAINDGKSEVEENWDGSYWKNDNVVQVQIHSNKYTYDELHDRLEAWKDEHDYDYVDFCNKVEDSIWAHIQTQENFQVFDAIMRCE